MNKIVNCLSSRLMALSVCIIVLFPLISSISFSQLLYERYFTPIGSACGVSAIKNSYPFSNPAMGVQDSNNVITAVFSPYAYGLKELSPGLISCMISLDKDFSAGGTIMGIGNELYNEFAAALAGSLRVSEYLSFGASFGLSRLGIKNYNNEYAYDLTIGGIFIINDNLKAGFLMRNITGSYYSGGDKTVNRQALVGVGFKPVNDLFIDAEISIDINGNAGISLGTAYEMGDLIRLRLALLTNPRSLEAGASVRLLPYLKLSTGLYYHDVLGFSQYGGVEFIW